MPSVSEKVSPVPILGTFGYNTAMTKHRSSRFGPTTHGAEWIFIFLLMALCFLATRELHQERTFILGANQTATSIALHADKEVVTLLGALQPTRVVLKAPQGSVFQVNELPEYAFTTNPGQRHDWLFVFLKTGTNEKSDAITFRMKTTADTTVGRKTNETQIRTGKHNTHTHSYYFFQAKPAQSSMVVNIGEYRNPGTAYFHTSGPEPTFEVVFKAPPGESFVWPADGTSFSSNQEGSKTPDDAVFNKEYRVKASPTMQAYTYWLSSANGSLYPRSLGAQYVTNPSRP